jgi:hypothetical protein
MKRITILAATAALLAFPAIGSTAAFASTANSPAAHAGIHAKHGADDPAGHRRHHRHGADDPAGHRHHHRHGADDPAGHHRHRHDG